MTTEQKPNIPWEETYEADEFLALYEQFLDRVVEMGLYKIYMTGGRNDSFQSLENGGGKTRKRSKDKGKVIHF